MASRHQCRAPMLRSTGLRWTRPCHTPRCAPSSARPIDYCLIREVHQCMLCNLCQTLKRLRASSAPAHPANVACPGITYKVGGRQDNSLGLDTQH